MFFDCSKVYLIKLTLLTQRPSPTIFTTVVAFPFVLVTKCGVFAMPTVEWAVNSISWVTAFCKKWLNLVLIFIVINLLRKTYICQNQNGYRRDEPKRGFVNMLYRTIKYNKKNNYLFILSRPKPLFSHVWLNFLYGRNNFLIMLRNFKKNGFPYGRWYGWW